MRNMNWRGILRTLTSRSKVLEFIKESCVPCFEEKLKTWKWRGFKEKGEKKHELGVQKCVTCALFQKETEDFKMTQVYSTRWWQKTHAPRTAWWDRNRWIWHHPSRLKCLKTWLCVTVYARILAWTKHNFL